MRLASKALHLRSGCGSNMWIRAARRDQEPTPPSWFTMSPQASSESVPRLMLAKSCCNVRPRWEASRKFNKVTPLAQTSTGRPVKGTAVSLCPGCSGKPFGDKLVKEPAGSL